MAGVASGITTLENLEKLIKQARKDGFTKKSEVFINCKDELAITFNDEKGYRGYFLDFETGKISYID
jgi:hypothetical protein